MPISQGARSPCAKCGNEIETEDQSRPQQKCPQCKNEFYCTRKCRKDDWKRHKKNCAQLASEQIDPESWSSAPTTTESPSEPRTQTQRKILDVVVDGPFTHLYDNTWVRVRPELDVYRLLIDAYRLRLDDDYRLLQIVPPDSIYNGQPSGLPGFQRFLSAVEMAEDDLLPDWWSPVTRRRCERFGQRTENNWHDLSRKVSSDAIAEAYGDESVPMQLRMFAETVTGSGPGDVSLELVKERIMSMEMGEIHLDFEIYYGD